MHGQRLDELALAIVDIATVPSGRIFSFHEAEYGVQSGRSIFKTALGRVDSLAVADDVRAGHIVVRVHILGHGNAFERGPGIVGNVVDHGHGRRCVDKGVDDVSLIPGKAYIGDALGCIQQSGFASFPLDDCVGGSLLGKASRHEGCPQDDCGDDFFHVFHFLFVIQEEAAPFPLCRAKASCRVFSGKELLSRPPPRACCVLFYQTRTLNVAWFPFSPNTLTRSIWDFAVTLTKTFSVEFTS